jgi:hypothetical protein
VSGGLAAAVAALSAALRDARPTWCSSETWTLATRLVDAARADLRGAVGPRRTVTRGEAHALGVGRSTLHRWLSARGWL